ncbi:hypothetical protein SFRURICE_013580 [Spodoptera frugiperda]|nr:hypothetical protein SFRURICE_013580 [Spodoptera frugiperda]
MTTSIGSVAPFIPEGVGSTLRYVLPLYNVHPLFTICVISPMTAKIIFILNCLEITVNKHTYIHNIRHAFSP